MPFTARDVIGSARAWSPTFDESTHPHAVLFDYLTTLIRIERQKLSAFAPELLLSQAVVTLPLTVFSDGAPIADAETIHTVTAVTDLSGETRGDPVALVPLEHMQDIGVWPAATWLGGFTQRLYLKGSAVDWRDYQQLLVNYVAVPAAVSQLDDDLDLPDQYRQVVVSALALFMAQRGGRDRVGPAQMQFFYSMLGDATQAANMSIGAQRAGEVFKVRELF